MEHELLASAPIGLFFRFPSEEEGMAALESAGFLNEESGFITASHTHCLDVIGAITRGGECDPETGEVITPPTVLEGFHFNFQGEVPDGWEQYAVHPQNPSRVWA